MSKKSLMVMWMVVLAALLVLPSLGLAQDIEMAEGAAMEDAGDSSGMGLIRQPQEGHSRFAGQRRARGDGAG